MSRVLDRVGKICQGCGVRLTIGEPNPNSTWAQQLTLPDKPIGYIIDAAAEFDQLTEHATTHATVQAGCHECQHSGAPDELAEHPSFVDFADWLAISARGPYRTPPAFEGTPRHNQNGGAAVMQHKGDTHRHPFPLPVQSNGIRHTKGRRAG